MAYTAHNKQFAKIAALTPQTVMCRVNALKFIHTERFDL